MRKLHFVFAAGLLPLSAQANIASTVESVNALEDKSSYQINDVIFLSQLQKRVITESKTQQAYYGLLSEMADVDSDSTLEAPEMRPSIAGYTPPTNGGFMPATSLAPKTDGYGMPLGLCVWDHGPTNSSANRITGIQTVTNADVSFGVISSGSDRSFNTTCADLAANTVQGDDVMVVVTVGQGNFGIASSQNKYFKSPVADKATLLGLDTSSSEPGEMRMVLDSGMAYAWLDLNNDGTYQWETVSSYFYSGDSNGATAGGEYTTNPYNVGIGSKFSDKTLTPGATLEIDGTARIVNGSGLVDTDGNAQLHIGNQEAPSGTAGEITRLAIQPYGHTGGPFNFVARDDGSSAYLDLRYGATTARTLISGKSTGGKQYVGINNPDPQATLDVAGNLYAESAAWNVLRKKKSSYSTAPYDDGLIMFEFTNAYSSGYATGGRTDNPLTIFASRSVEYNSSPIHHYEAKSQGYYNHPNVNYLSRIQYGSLNRGSYYFRAQEYYQKKVWDDEFWIKGGGHSYFKGKMGIGTQTPQEKLHVQDGSIRLQGDTQYVAYHALRTAPAASTDDDGDGYERFSMGIHSSRGSSHIGSSFGLEFLPNIDVTTAPAMTILENGKIGIGSTAPTSELDVAGLTTSDRLLLDQTSGVDYSGQILNTAPLAKGLLISGGDTGKDASLLKVESGDSSQQFFEVTDGQVAIGSTANDTEFCLNGDCATKVKTVKTGTATINNSTFTKIAYVDGQSLYSALDFSIQGSSSNVVINSDFHINVGHNQSIYVESTSQAYTAIELKIHAGYDGATFGDEADYLIYARLISNDGPTNLQLEASLTGNANITFNPTQSVTAPGTEHIHTTKKIGKAISGTSAQEPKAGLHLNGNPVIDVKGRNVMEHANMLSPGWYTIATNSNNRATARFAVKAYASGYHQNTVFYANQAFGGRHSINVLSSMSYNQNVIPIDQIRIIDGGFASVYAGAMLQVHVDEPSVYLEAMILGDNFGSPGWELVDWVPDGTDPGGLSNFSAIADSETTARVTLGPINQGGISTSAGINISGHKKFGGDYPTDNENTDNALTFGKGRSETFQIFRQNSGSSNSFCGASNYIDCYVFMMSDNNSVNPDGSIKFGGIGNDDVFESYLTISGQGKTNIRSSTQGSLTTGWNVLNVISPYARGTMGALNGTYFHLSTTASSGFYFYKPVTAVGGFNTASDIRLKKDIKPINSALDGIRKLSGYSYGWRAEEFPERGLPQDKREYGVIAQELEPIFPELVTTNGDGFKTVTYDGLIPVLIEATKELDQKNQEQDDEIARHERILKGLKADIQKQEQRLKVLEKTSPKGSESDKEAANDATEINLETEAANDTAEPPAKHRNALGRFYGG